MEYKEFLEAARLIVNEGLAIKKGERVMILTDHGVDDIEGLASIRQALLDVMIEQELDPLPVTREQFYEIGDITTKVGAKVKGGVHQVHLMAPNGTDMTFNVGTLRQAVHTGIAHEPGMAIQLPAGCVNMGVDEGTANGTMVVDYTSAVSNGRMNGKVVFEIKDGYAVSISGDQEEVDKFVNAAAQHEGTQKEKYNVAEFGLGMQRKAEMNGSGGEGEYLYGGAHIGLGSNVAFWGSVFIPAWHVDCIIPCATVEVDGELIAENGEYKI